MTDAQKLAKLITKYYEWLEIVERVVSHQVVLVSKSPNDPTVTKDTDELFANGYSLKGQQISTSRATGNVFIAADLLTFAKWLEQQE